MEACSRRTDRDGSDSLEFELETGTGAPAGDRATDARVAGCLVPVT